MKPETQVEPVGAKASAPLLFGKRQALTPEVVRPYAGTDTERDIKG